MWIQKEEKIVIVLLLMALSNLAVANWALSDQESDESAAYNANKGEEAQDLIVVEGAVSKIQPTKTGGHLIFRLDSTRAQIFVPNDNGANDVEEMLSPGARVRVTGRRTTYNGEEEIEVQRAEDVLVLRP